MSTKEKIGEEQAQAENVPSWAKRVQMHITGATLVVGGVTALIIALAGLFAVIPWPNEKIDCANYADLTPEEKVACEIED